MSNTLKKKSEVYTDRHSSTVKAEVGARVQRRQNMTGQQPLSNSSTQVHHARYLQHTAAHQSFIHNTLYFNSSCCCSFTTQRSNRAKDALKTCGSLLFLVVCSDFFAFGHQMRLCSFAQSSDSTVAFQWHRKTLVHQRSHPQASTASVLCVWAANK